VRGRPILVAGALAVILAACEREQREFRPNPVADETEQQITQSSLSPGPGAPIEAENNKGDQYVDNAYHVSEGKRLYTWMNCQGCHFNGGGGIGPPLMDDEWVYGSEMENIVLTIKEGRPNGMPSFRGKIPEDQIWQIAAYVRSMAGLVRKDVAPSRSDSIQARPAENEMPPVPPPPGSEPQNPSPVINPQE
jgi:cytochrome c oxidase cbb3-type subunit 3